jgi:hypothetical protein
MLKKSLTGPMFVAIRLSGHEVMFDVHCYASRSPAGKLGKHADRDA